MRESGIVCRLAVEDGHGSIAEAVQAFTDPPSERAPAREPISLREYLDSAAKLLRMRYRSARI
jgi:hypothetical protein